MRSNGSRARLRSRSVMDCFAAPGVWSASASRTLTGLSGVMFSGVATVLAARVLAGDDAAFDVVAAVAVAADAFTHNIIATPSVSAVRSIQPAVRFRNGTTSTPYRYLLAF